MPKKKKAQTGRIAAENRKARHQYFIEDSLEAGIMLEGSEVKSLREGRANIAESYATVEGAELWLINSYIPPFSQPCPLPSAMTRAAAASCWSTSVNWPGSGRPSAARA